MLSLDGTQLTQMLCNDFKNYSKEILLNLCCAVSVYHLFKSNLQKIFSKPLWNRSTFCIMYLKSVKNKKYQVDEN
jgi:phage gp36-like protein